MNEYRKFDFYNSRGLSGLQNLGNTCYMNASIQCLSHTMDLVHYFISKNYEKDVSKKNHSRTEFHIVIRFIEVLSLLWKENQTVNPKFFKMNLEGFVKRFVGYQQQDSHECTIAILDLIHKGLSTPVEMTIRGKVNTLNDSLKKQAAEIWKLNYSQSFSFIIEHFYGQLVIKTKCPECDYKSYTFDPYNCLSLDIPKIPEVTLLDCLSKSSQPEMLDDDNKWFCEKCNKKVNGVRETSIWKLPDILIIQLKKFKSKQKVNFDLNNFKIGNNNYFLYAVTNHSGTIHSGHYWAYCKRDSKWYNFNDTVVSPIDATKVISEENYVLFFKKA